MTAGTEQGPASGRRSTLRRAFRAGVAAAGLLLVTLGGAPKAAAEDRALYLYNLHTKEKATIVFKRDGVMTPEKFFHAGPVNGWRRR